MNILILGSGGREHSLAWAIKQNPKCDRLIVAPGNAGIEQIAELARIDINNPAAVLDLVLCERVDFVVIGPETPLAAGMSDHLTANGVLTFGPSKAAAQLESSKHFTKTICDAANVPTAAYAHFGDAAAAKAHISAQGAPIVIKADGLAAGKGVVVAQDIKTAHGAVDDMFGGALGAAGTQVVIEEFMHGEEASFFVLCDGQTVLPIGTAQDHKRRDAGDTGPNTGGMGAYSPAPIVTDALQVQVLERIIKPTVKEMSKRNIPFCGVLYAGLMIKDGTARLVEYNARFGDPECQVLMMRLGGQILDLLLACAQGSLALARVQWADDYAMTVVMAANGYPGAYQKGTMIGGVQNLPQNAGQMCFHAGTKMQDGQLTAAGGRVLNLTARAETLHAARDKAYALAQSVEWPDGFYRSDIGWRALGNSQR